jgi:hypothetical protein
MTKAWLEDVDWELIIDINKELCAPKNALHKATSDGFEETKILWKPITRDRWDSTKQLNFAVGAIA